jgi:uncharacterized membrane protein HdeD (DUF308 family)
MTAHDVIDLQNRIRIAIQQHWKAVLIEGIVSMLLGLAAVVLPSLASMAVTLFLGWALLAGGVVGLVLTVWARQLPGFWWSLLSGLLAVCTGVALLVWPTQGTLALTVLVAAYFLAEGALTIVYALAHRRELSERWGWLLASGLLDLMLGLFIAVWLPDAAGWLIGLLIGIDMIFGGAALVAMALAARRAARLRTDCGWGELLSDT